MLNLTENHRQGADKEFADCLNRVREVEQGKLTEEDKALLETRVRPEGHEDLKAASINIVCTKKKCAEMNSEYINNLKGEAVTINAIHYRRTQKNYKPGNIQVDGTVGGTGFMNELTVKVGAKVVMIWNINTVDCLTNGQTGIVMAIIKDSSGEVNYLIIKFNQERAGRQKRSENKQLEQKYPGGTKVEKFNLTYTLTGRSGSGSTANLVQFPVRLAHALTAHKTQGQTYKTPMTITVDLRDVFEGAQGYVMLGRPEELKQLFIVDKLDPKKLYSDKRVTEEHKKMNNRSINKNPSVWDTNNPAAIKISSLNCARLRPHLQDIRADHTLRKSDILHLQETWLEEGEDLSQFHLRPSYYYSSRYEARHIIVGKGKGITTFYNKKFQHTQDLVSQHYQMTKFESKEAVSINIYRSALGSTREILEKITQLEVPGKSTIVTGDFNTCARKERTGLLVRSMLERGYTLHTKDPTHTQGGHIDHAYTKDAKAQLHRYTPYYSDHDSLCLTVEQVK